MKGVSGDVFLLGTDTDTGPVSATFAMQI